MDVSHPLRSTTAFQMHTAFATLLYTHLYWCSLAQGYTSCSSLYGVSRPDRLREIADRFNLDHSAMLDNILYARAYTSKSLGDSKLTLTSNIILRYSICTQPCSLIMKIFLLGLNLGEGIFSPCQLQDFPSSTLLNFIQQSNTMNLAMK